MAEQIRLDPSQVKAIGDARRSGASLVDRLRRFEGKGGGLDRIARFEAFATQFLTRFQQAAARAERFFELSARDGQDLRDVAGVLQGTARGAELGARLGGPIGAAVGGTAGLVVGTANSGQRLEAERRALAIRNAEFRADKAIEEKVQKALLDRQGAAARAHFGAFGLRRARKGSTR